MKHNVEFKNFEPEKRIQKLIEDLIKKLDKKLKSLPRDVVFLRLMIEQNSVRTLYRLSLTLSVPGKTLATKSERHDLEDALRDAFAEIDRQLEAHKATLRGDHPWRRRARRKELRQMKMQAGSVEQGNRELFFSLASQHLKDLYDFVRHELAYSESVGDLVPGELTPEDVIDAVLVRAYREFVKGPAGQEMRTWLQRLVTEQIQADIQRLKAERDTTVHIEEDIPETPPTEEVSTLGEEILYFYQPDEDLKLEDVIPDLRIPSPEQIAETKELRRCVNVALAGLPKEWRQALWLRYGEGLTGAKLAQATRQTQAEIERIVEYALQYVRQKLVELGCKFEQEDGRPVARTPDDVKSEAKVAKRSGGR